MQPDRSPSFVNIATSISFWHQFVISIFKKVLACVASITFGLIVGIGKPAFADIKSMRGDALAPLPKVTNVDFKKVLLGEQLFHDSRLSGNDTVSCATCHDLANGGSDGLKIAIGINGKQGNINTPTVFNSVFNVAQFWNGRAGTLQEQAPGPVHNPAEMGSNWPEVVAKLETDAHIKSLFYKSYKDGITGDNIVNAIAEYERTLVTRDAPFDQYLRGDKTAISDKAKKGYNLFLTYGCSSCHQGINIGGNMYQTMGVMGHYFQDKGHNKKSDQGRYDVTKNEQDRHVFKVPSLRLVSKTAPYFHDGSAATLKDAIKDMATYQLGRTIPDHEITLIIEFLNSLAGKYTRFKP